MGTSRLQSPVVLGVGLVDVQSGMRTPVRRSLTPGVPMVNSMPAASAPLAFHGRMHALSATEIERNCEGVGDQGL